jgi:hypothetical protein
MPNLQNPATTSASDASATTGACVQCGAPGRPGGRFCGACGGQVVAQAPPVEPAPPPGAVGTLRFASAPPPPPAPVPVRTTGQTGSLLRTADGRRRSAAWIFYALCAIACLVASPAHPKSILGAAIAGLYAIYLFRGGRFVLWIF